MSRSKEFAIGLAHNADTYTLAQAERRSVNEQQLAEVRNPPKAEAENTYKGSLI